MFEKQTGRKPSGLCGAALYMSALANGFKCSKSDIVSFHFLPCDWFLILCHGKGLSILFSFYFPWGFLGCSFFPISSTLYLKRISFPQKSGHTVLVLLWFTLFPPIIFLLLFKILYCSSAEFFFFWAFIMCRVAKRFYTWLLKLLIYLITYLS